MAVMIKYHSVTSNEIVTDFLGFIEVYRATAEAFFLSLTEFLGKVGLDYKKEIGLGTDGASNLCGKHNSVYSRFRDETWCWSGVCATLSMALLQKQQRSFQRTWSSLCGRHGIDLPKVP
ncbi:Zinc finger MYM-type protein 1 [Frankliniella fusca]|uniref:Zinc finger MYM-type protein 1 n=1 Tax=Frankliniella fusca TaxID=407009 RepID=A0AAE1L9H1_9NEOP|nr:Zinc finger MYM-type protein 1 [Frankliniella fusca]